jgi:hypothetical protein
LVENGWHGYYTSEAVKEIMAEYFKLNQVTDENKTAISYTQKTN